MLLKLKLTERRVNLMDLVIDGELIEVDADEYKDWIIAHKTGKGYDD